MMAELVLMRNFDRSNSHTISSYRSAGGYAAWEKAKTLEPAAITDEVKKSNLRGLGGAGFPTGMKWSFIPKTHTGPVYLVVNADEGEPGTFKDRYLLERDPHALIEGMLITARAIRSALGFVYIRGEYVEPWRRFSAAVKEAYEARLLGDGFDLRPPPSRAPSASRRSSTTSRRSAACRRSSSAAPRGSPGWGPRRRAARGCTPSRGA